MTLPSRRNGRVALLESDVGTPAEMFGRRRAAHSSPITTPGLQTRALGEVRDVSFTSGDAEIHGYMTLPRRFRSREALSADRRPAWRPRLPAQPRVRPRRPALRGGRLRVLAVNPRGSSGRGFDFSRAIYADWGNLDAQDISAGITPCHRHAASPIRSASGSVGWSYGGILTDYMIASDKRISAAVSGAGVGNVLATFGVDMYAREYLLELGHAVGELRYLAKARLPIPASRSASPRRRCSSARMTTTTCPASGAEQMYLALKTRGVPTQADRLSGRKSRARRCRAIWSTACAATSSGSTAG